MITYNTLPSLNCIYNTTPYTPIITASSLLLDSNIQKKEDYNELKINIKKTPIKFNFNL